MLLSFETKMQERFTKILNAMVTHDENKYCFDCHQRGPIYVNVTIGSFVCTNCGGALRKYNHRVKSISMSNFTPAEIDFLRKRGNKTCRKIYLALSDDQSLDEKNFQNGARDEYLRTKYQIQKWYRRPSAELEAEAVRENQEIIDRAEQNGVQRPTGTNTAAGLIVMPSRLTGASTGSVAINEEKPPPSAQNSIQLKSANQVPTTASSSFDPFGTLQKDPFETRSPGLAPTMVAANDPFGVSATAALRDSTVTRDPFSTFELPNSHVSTVPASQPTLPFKQSAEVPHSGTWTSAFMQTSASQTNFAATNMGDKYAALAELDGIFKGSSVTTTSTSSAVLSSVSVSNQTAIHSRGPMNWSETFSPPTNSFFSPPLPLAPLNTVQLPPSAHNPFASSMMTSTGVPRQYSASNPFITNQPVPCMSRPVVPTFQSLANSGISMSANSAVFQPLQSGAPNPFHTPATQLPVSCQATWASHLNSNPIGSTLVPPGTGYPLNGFPPTTTAGIEMKPMAPVSSLSNFDSSLFQ
ncbi:Arf GTPase activating protein [Fasciola hepatica]|uniref:Arf GTPase activating protein n=1 Tax=Fasciola hepatica TaxID=6192 RepID=A0A4E0R7W4_FASHE|nr:Arf GTPase activating protein [Fasciola hepatica]